jgi:hypothetical protein
MSANSVVRLREKRNGLLAIVIGGLSAGILDLTQALILFGPRVPLGIAAGLLGPQAAHGGGIAIYVLGVFLHFFIAFSAATAYYVASRTLKFLTEHWFICGLIYGTIVDQVMTLIVLPLSALHAHGPHKLHDLLLGIGVHVFTVGLPISFSVRRFAK